MKRKVTSLVAEESFPLCVNCGNVLVYETVETCINLGVNSLTCNECNAGHDITLYPKYKRNNGKKMYQLSWEY